MSALQLVHYWTTLGSLVLGLLSVLTIVTGLCHPTKSTRGDRLVSFGLVFAIATTAVYLVYAVTVITTVVVMRT